MRLQVPSAKLGRVSLRLLPTEIASPGGTILLQRALSRNLLLSVLAIICPTGRAVTTAQAADAPRVSIGDVAVASEAKTAGERGPELSQALRAALKDELSRATQLSSLKRPLIVSATLTRLSSERVEARTKASATISLALRRADDQILFAELRGRASVEETTNNPALLRRRALEGAVRGAIARLPEAVERSPR
jgi:hypothetical protein